MGWRNLFRTCFFFITFLISQHNAAVKKQNSYNQDVASVKNNVAHMQQTTDPQSIDSLYNTSNSIIEKGKSLEPSEKTLESFQVQLDQIEDNAHDIIAVSPQVLSDLSLSFPSAKPNSLSLLGNSIILTSQASNSLYSINSNNPSSGTKISSNLISQPVATVGTDQNSVMVYDKDNGLLQIDKSGIVTQIPGLSDIKNIVAIGAYNKNLYFLDPTDQIIYRSVAIGSGYSVASSYINDKVLQSATSLSIDGNVFVASPLSGITRYFAGVQTPLSMGNTTLLGKPLGPLTYIYTSMYLENVYILDPQNKRIIVLAKPTGSDTVTYAFAKQYVYKGKQKFFNDLTAFSIDSAEKNMYVLDGTKVLKVSL